jgi:putative membrane protein
MPILIGRTVFGAAILGTLALTGCDTKPGDQSTQGTVVREDADGTVTTAAAPTPPIAMDVSTYVSTAASGDLFEIRSSELALELSRNETVRDFAERMIADHRDNSEALRTAVARAERDIPVPTAMMPRHMSMISELQQVAAGTDRNGFDQLYMNQQRTAHAEALDLHRQMAQRTDAPASLREFAASTAQKIEQHNELLTSMQMPSTAGDDVTKTTG